MLMSHLQDNIHQSYTIPTQILFNRTMAQLGLSAFRCGLIMDAHSCFDELCCNNRLKELLAQGISSQRYNDRNETQERAERKRQTPYHMHINLELIECCHLVGAFLLEIPKMVAMAYDSKRKWTSRALKRVFDNSDRNPLSGPPETTRDVIMAGARALEKGDWRQCEAHILALPVWTQIGSEDSVVKVTEMLRRKIKEEALRTFLFAYSAFYDALSLEQLCDMFELERQIVNTLVSKMIISEELFASWDQPTGSIVMHKKERSRLHHISLQYSDLLGKLVESNEKGWDQRYGGYEFKQQNKAGGGWQRGPRGERGERGERGGERGPRVVRGGEYRRGFEGQRQ
uniref:PCI domain-containing protein n=2 Tax=Hanusia phi TaxID=3032 RepID=A0A7S0NDK3_9CRYP|mmetsp:Transcript_7254/g.16600  ORF Transcript_7254/g.16600 Transcript_7254/m.16600 type:complete len:343 (+) Transcript_7254:15-1043(+)